LRQVWKGYDDIGTMRANYPPSTRRFLVERSAAQEQFKLSDILEIQFDRFSAHGGTNLTSAELVARGETGHQRVNPEI